MKHFFKSLLVGVFCMAVAAVASASPPTPLLWKVEADAGVMYLLGSFHLLTEDDYPLHPAVEQAYAEADALVFEVDPAEMASPEFVQMVLSMAKFDDGRTLRDVISPETAEKLKAFMGGSDAALASADMFKPWYTGLNLTIGNMTSMGLNPALGLDQHFMNRAKSDGKPVSGLETGMDQMQALDRTPMSEQEHMLAEALRPVGELRESIRELHGYWRAGDERMIEKKVNEDMVKETPRMYELLNRERNSKWLPQVVAMLDQDQTRLVVVGAMHLIGEDGLVHQLKLLDIHVERVDTGTDAEPELLDEAA